VYVVAYDLLPVTHPHWFPVSEKPIFEKWLKTIKEFDGVISISRATSEALNGWMQENPRRRERPFRSRVAHIGADIAESVPSKGLPLNAKDILSKISNHTAFLMVGTVEPRKGHDQVLEAFEYLWSRGLTYQLVIVGKPGWNVAQLVKRFEQHLERNKLFYWLPDISDEFLEMLYECSACLLAASEGEGFGLPIIEAAQHGLPVLARDIFVFREIAGEHASYFVSNNGLELSHELENWSDKFATDTHIKSLNLSYSTWSRFAEECEKLFANGSFIT
jgi:glycosyltransferase involved in cell wall biosynthesis